jgi:hypothetical protein
MVSAVKEADRPGSRLLDGRGRAARAFLAVGIGALAGLLGCERAPLCPDVFFDTPIPVPAVNLTLPPTSFPINAVTTSAPAGVAVTIASNQGTIVFDGRGPLPAFIYERIPFPAADSTLYAGLGIADGAWIPFYLYCSSDGRLTQVAGEMTDRDLGLQYAVEGTCTYDNVAPMAPVVIPAHTLNPVALTCGVTATAPAPQELDLSGGVPGTITLAGDSAVVLPFHTIDCRTGCGSPGWYEVHSIVWDQSRSMVAFAVIYLQEAGVEFDDGLILPSGNLLNGDQFPNATWSVTR